MKRIYAVFLKFINQHLPSIKIKFEFLFQKKNLVWVYLIGFFFLTIILIMFISLGNDKRSKGVTLSDSKSPLPDLKRFHLFEGETLSKRETIEYLILPEKVNVESDKNHLKEVLENHKLFNRSEIIIQLEINKLK